MVRLLCVILVRGVIPTVLVGRAVIEGDVGIRWFWEWWWFGGVWRLCVDVRTLERGGDGWFTFDGQSGRVSTASRWFSSLLCLYTTGLDEGTVQVHSGLVQVAMACRSLTFRAFVACTSRVEFAAAEGVAAIELGTSGGNATFWEDVAPDFARFEACAGNGLAVAGKVWLFVFLRILVLWAWFTVISFWFLFVSADPFFVFDAFGGEETFWEEDVEGPH